MKIHELKPPAGAHRPKKRVGRGNAAGQGTTCGRGTKGQRARTGRVPAWFEGGQMPLQRRVPKRGFNRTRFKTEVQTDFTRERLAELGLIDPDGGPVKVLARGNLDRVVKVTANAFSAAARDAIEAAGGTAETIGRKK
jgi:large subunit ribosomal protein L15